MRLAQAFHMFGILAGGTLGLTALICAAIGYRPSTPLTIVGVGVAIGLSLVIVILTWLRDRSYES